MAMIFMDGFDANDFATKWSAVNNTASSTTVTRFGTGRSQSISYTGTIIKLLPVAANTLYIGFGARCSTGSAGRKMLTLYGDGGISPHIRLDLANDTTFRLSRGDNAVLATAALGSHTPNTWEHIEMMVTVADTGGRVIVRVNGVVIIDFTGDTKNGGTNTSIDTLRFNSLGSNDGVNDLYLDDLYVLDDTGTTNNTFLGDVRIHTLPVDGPGTDSQLTPTGSATNWQNIDELPGSTTDYNSTTIPGQRDSYAHLDVPVGVNTIHSVQTNLTLAKSDAGAAMMKPLVRSGGTVYYDPTINLSSSPVLYSIPHDTNPASSTAWTVSAVNGMETGAEAA